MTIKNCFQKGGFTSRESCIAQHDLPTGPEKLSPEGINEDEFNEWIGIDANLEIAFDSTEEEIYESYPEKAGMTRMI